MSQSVDDRPAQDAKRRQLEENARELLKAISCGLELESAESIRPLLALKRCIQDLAAGHQKLAMEEQSVEATLRESSEHHDALQQQLAQTEQTQDPSRLYAAVSSAQRAGDLDTQLDDARSRLSARQDQCRVELARLGLWSGSLEQLERAPLPSSETVGLFETRFQEAADQTRGRARQLDEVRVRRNELTGQLVALQQSGPVPSTGDLEASRTHRDAGWTLVRRQCFDHADVDEQIRRFAADRALPDAYEQAVRVADEIADRLRSDADRVQQREILEADLHKADLRLEALQAETKEHDQAAATLAAGMASDLGSGRDPAPNSPGDGRLASVPPRPCGSTSRSCGCPTGRSRSSPIAELTTAERWSRSLDALGEDRGQASDDEHERLAPLVERALALLEELGERVAQRRELERDIEEARASVGRAEEATKGLTERRGLWERDWKETVAGFEFLSETSVAKVLATLEQLEELFRRIDEANGRDG